MDLVFALAKDKPCYERIAMQVGQRPLCFILHIYTNCKHSASLDEPLKSVHEPHVGQHSPTYIVSLLKL